MKNGLKGASKLEGSFACKGENVDTKVGLNFGIVSNSADREIKEVSIRLDERGYVFDKDLVEGMLSSIGVTEILEFYYDGEHGGFVIDVVAKFKKKNDSAVDAYFEKKRMEEALNNEQMELLDKDHRQNEMIGSLEEDDLSIGTCNGYYKLITKSIEVYVNGVVYVAEEDEDGKALYDEEYDLVYAQNRWAEGKVLFNEELIEDIYKALDEKPIEEVIYV